MSDSKRRFETWMSYLSDIGAHFHHDTEQEAFDMLNQDKESEGRVFFVSEIAPNERVFSREEMRDAITRFTCEITGLERLNKTTQSTLDKELNFLFSEDVGNG